jgi:hypothetical protein
VNVLGYIIPAIREIRAPLVGGYLWLLAAWLNFGDWVPDRPGEESPWDQLVRLRDAIGAVGVAAAISVAAVLVGSLVGELITFITARRWERPSVIESLGELVPEAKYAANTAVRTFAEAEFRLHASLPLVVVGASLVANELGIGLAILVLAALIGAHGVVLLRRWAQQADAARVVAEERTDALSDQERQQRKADLRLAMTDRGTAGQTLHISNSGRTAARDVTMVDPKYRRQLSFISDGLLPIDQIPPGASIGIPFALSLADPGNPKVLLQWVDGAGPHEEERTLRPT